MPRFKQHGPSGMRRGFQQRVVLHAARADLQNVGILGDQRNVVLRHDFGHDGQTALFARASQHLQAFQAKPLKCVRRTARLEGASTQNARSGAAHMVGRGHQLELGLHRAGPGHGDKFAAADLKVQHRHDWSAGAARSSAHREFRQIVRANLHAPCALRSGEAFRLPEPCAPRLHRKVETERCHRACDRYRYLRSVNEWTDQERLRCAIGGGR